MNSKSNKEGQISVLFYGNNEFGGIFNYFKTHGNIENEINITNSPLQYENKDLAKKVFLFDEDKKYYRSKSIPNAFICFEFKNKRIIPKNYTIKTAGNNLIRPKSWVIEGSNDNENWQIIDEQNNCEYMNDYNRTRTFSINNDQNDEFRYIRLRQTSENWFGKSYANAICIGSLEFYGFLT